MVGTIQDPFTSLTEPEDPVTAKPLQLVLWLLAAWMRGVRVICEVGRAAALARKESTMNAAVIAVWKAKCFGSFIFRENLAKSIEDKTCGKPSEG
jgi:hypothetical protein